MIEPRGTFYLVETKLPPKPMKVAFLYTDNSIDFAYWDGKDFLVFDPSRELPVKSWQPFETHLQLQKQS